jgi:hypothetical protein
VSVTRAVMVLGLALYVFLWVLAANGASDLVAPLLVPLVLVVLIAAGVGLDRSLGITPRKQHFDDKHFQDEDDERR